MEEIIIQPEVKSRGVV